MSTEGLAVMVKMEDASMYARVAIKQFPKAEKFQLGAEIRTCNTEIKRLLIRATKRYFKKTTLEDLDIELDVLRSLVREAHTLKYMDTHKYEVLSLKISEVGRMVGSWKKRVETAESSRRTRGKAVPPEDAELPHLGQ